MTDEADRKSKLVREVNALPGGAARRLEDKYAVGLLDLVIKLPGHPFFWAEGKMIDGNVFGPTARQHEEGMRWIKAGVPVLLIGWKRTHLFVSPWTKQANIENCFNGPSPWLTTLQNYLNQKAPK